MQDREPSHGGRCGGGWWPLAAARLQRPGQRAAGDRGMVTAELAVALPALVLVVLALAWGLGLGASQALLGQAAREGARAAARGEGTVEVTREVHRLVAGAAVTVRHSGDRVIVGVRVRREPGPRLLRPLARELTASATAWWERP